MRIRWGGNDINYLCYDTDTGSKQNPLEHELDNHNNNVLIFCVCFTNGEDIAIQSHFNNILYCGSIKP